MFQTFLIVGGVASLLGTVMLLNLGGAADKMARFYSGPPRWLPGPPGGHKAQAHRIYGAIYLGFGAALVAWALLAVRD